MFCSNCGQELPAGARFCNDCGAPVTPGDATADITAENPADAAVAESEAEAKAGAEAWAEAEALDETVIEPPLPTPKPGSALVPPPGAHAEGTTRTATPTTPAGPAAAAAAAAHATPHERAETSPRTGTAVLEEEPSPGTLPGDSDAGIPGGRGGGPGGGEGRGGAGGPGQPGGGRTNWAKWLTIALASLIVLALAIALPLLLTRDGDEPETTTTSSTTTTVAEQTTTTAASTTTSSTAAPPTTTPAGGPGDSEGEWVERTAPSIPSGAGVARGVAVSDEYLLFVAGPESGGNATLYAQSLTSGEIEQLPTEGTDVAGIDIDGNTAVWWEGTYDEAAAAHTDQHIYAYTLPSGPRVEIVGNREVSYPQVAGDRITWIETGPWETDPEEYARVAIYGTTFPAGGRPSEPQVLVPQALAFLLGDSGWHYSLGENHLAWEQATTEGDFQPGSYVLDLTDPTSAPLSMGTDSWRPSVSGDRVVAWNDGLVLFDPSTKQFSEIDPAGDFASAAPTYVAYLRVPEEPGDYEIVARGVTRGHEQVLGTQSEPPWLAPGLAAGNRNVAFITDRLHVFEWKGG